MRFISDGMLVGELAVRPAHLCMREAVAPPPLSRPSGNRVRASLRAELMAVSTQAQ
jgi:hypothetical protein